MITMERAGVLYKGAFQALTEMSLKINKGEFVYITGKSGAGKSTLLRLIYADLLPTRGVVKVIGSDITMLKNNQIPYLRRQIGVIFQDYQLLEDRTVFDNVRMALDIYYFKKSQSRDRIWPLLKKLGIFELRDRIVRQLSGGEKQRVCIARAIINQPQIVLADEPTGSLDEENADIILKMLKSAANSGVTVIMATHDTQIRLKYPAREIHLDSGRLVIDRKPSAGGLYE